jgi:hypothetical protein
VTGIDTREELVDALTDASELEHGILLQYLFAAYSLKKRADEGLGPFQQELVRSWAGTLTTIARQEMAHLGCVCNLMAAIGGAPRMGRPNFPQPAGRYYPFDFRLQRFGDEALYRFVCLELPEGEPPPTPPRRAGLVALVDVVPDPLTFTYLGELYGKIRRGFREIPERELFIGPSYTQDTDDWSNRFSLRVVTDRVGAEASIDAIVLEGEGAPGRRDGSHYASFLELREQLDKVQGEGFDPARPVVDDPRTRDHPEAAEGGTLLSDPVALRVAEIFNATYITVLLLLLQYYSFGGETEAQRVAIRSALRHLMSGVVRPLGEVLTELPAGVGGAGTAGPPFELYSDVRLATQVDTRWPIVLERLAATAAAATDLGGVVPRLDFLAQNLRWIGVNLRAVTGSSR